MKVLFRVLKIFAVLVVVSVLTLFTASLLMQDKIAGIILKSLNKNISTKFSFGSTHLSFIRKFPKASLDLKEVVVFSSPGFDRHSFGNINTDTLLKAKTVRAEFSITDIINGIYNIDRIGVIEGCLNLFSDTAGKANYEISSEAKGQESNFKLNLERINLSDLKAIYFNQATKLLIRGIVEDGRLKTRIAGDQIDFTATGKIRTSLFRLYNFTVSEPVMTNIDLKLHSSDKGISFEKSVLTVNDYDFGISGFISSSDVLDLSLTADNIDISDVKKYFPAKYLEKISSYNPTGTLNINGKILGLISRIVNPGIDIRFSLRDGGATYGNSALTIKDLSFNGYFTNGPGMVPGTSSLSFSDFKGTLGSAQYSGSLTLSDFDSLRGDLLLKGKIIPSEIKEFFNIRNISSTKGTVDFDLKINGYIPVKEKVTLPDIFSLCPRAELKFNSFAIGLRNDRIKISNTDGTVHVSDTITADNLKFQINEHKLSFNGVVRNLPGWLAGQPAVLSLSGDVTCDEMYPDKLIGNPAAGNTTISQKKSFSFPDDIVMDLNFRIGSFNYRTFSAENISGLLSYKPKLVNFKTLNLSSQDGVISGNGFILQNPDKSYVSRGSFIFDNINVRKAFVSFRNFGQDFIKSDNLEGRLSGSLSVLIPMDSLMTPLIKSVTAEGKYLLENGVLVNFEPVKELSDFIELSELENIKFERLENDFFIRSNVLYMPQMDVRSSAADLSINGRHDFDNNYEYHVKVLLSEILSRKIRKPKPNTTEFGAIKDDDIGRTSVLLKIVNKGEDVKVTYDVRAAGNQIKNDIRSERQTLKTILNEEYGWFKNDTAITRKQTPRTPRFRITWEESDTVKSDTDSLPVKNENPVRSVFRKK